MSYPSYSMVHVENPNPDQLDISELFRSDYNHVVKRQHYNELDDSLHIYEYLKNLFNGSGAITFPAITLASDSAISFSTISGACEALMSMRSVDGHVIADGDIHLIYIDSTPDIQTTHVETHEQLTGQIISNALGINEMSFCRHRVNMSAKNIHYFGLNDDLMTDNDRKALDDYNLENYSLQLLRKKGIGRILTAILHKLEYENIMVVFDMCAMKKKSAPSTYRHTADGGGDETEDGFDELEIIEIFNILRDHKLIRGIDITGFNFGLRGESTKNMASNQQTMKVIENILKLYVDIKKNSINIFNENSKFVIWRKSNDPTEDPVGWKILKGMSLEERNDLMTSIDNNRVIQIQIVDEEMGENYEAMVAITTVEEQQEKSYYFTDDPMDRCLLPGEKIDMVFELLNTPQNKIAE